MKTLIISAVAAVIGHAMLFTLSPSWQKPQVNPRRAQPVTVTLAPLLPIPQPVQQPLPVPRTEPISPLKPLALKKPPPKPPPVSKPQPPPEAPKVAAEPPAPSPDQLSPVPPVQAESLSKADAMPAVSSVSEGEDTFLSSVDRQTVAQDEIAVSDPFPIFHPKPDYPRLAQRRQYQGKVILQALVDIHGRVVRVDLVQSSGHSILDRSATKSVLQWRFAPATRNGVPVEKTVEFPVVFRIE